MPPATKGTEALRVRLYLSVYRHTVKMRVPLEPYLSLVFHNLLSVELLKCKVCVVEKHPECASHKLYPTHTHRDMDDEVLDLDEVVDLDEIIDIDDPPPSKQPIEFTPVVLPYDVKKHAGLAVISHYRSSDANEANEATDVVAYQPDRTDGEWEDFMSKRPMAFRGTTDLVEPDFEDFVFQMNHIDVKRDIFVKDPEHPWKSRKECVVYLVGATAKGQSVCVEYLGYTV